MHVNKIKLAKAAGAFICVMSVVVLTVNMFNMHRYLFQQSQHHGETRLQSVSTDMQRTLEKSKNTLLRFAADVEVYITKGADESELRAYLRSQSGVFRDQSNDTLLNSFICSPELMLTSDSPLPDGYVVTERDWYKNTVKSGIENIYITAPYYDLFTGEMCFTAAMMLSDGKTIVGLDFNLSHIRSLVEQMNREVSGETIIISRDGLVVGYTDGEYSGKKLNEVLPEYVDIYNRLINEENDSVITNAYIGGKKSTAFCNRSGDWLFVYTVDNDELYSDAYKIIVLNFAPRITMLILFIVYFLCTYKALGRENAVQSSDAAENANADRINARTKEMASFTKNTRNGIMSIMTLTVLVAVVFTGTVLVRWGNDRMKREVDSYSYQLERWMNTQLQTLSMFVDTISANPSVLDDYDYAVEYLDKIVHNHPEISAAYIARPGNQHEMTMNNGWIPNADYKVAERQWYIDTVASETKTSVSSPYPDARTGLYCVTFSKVVYDSETSEQIGVFALDFYIENLTGIMEASYSDDGYAFLVDNSNIIVNHPNEEYQISSEKSMNISGTEYEDVKNSLNVHIIRDYDGKVRVSIAHTESLTGFSVIAVKDVMSVYGVVILSGSVFIVLLLVCIVLLYNLIVKMMNWQESARKALIEEAERASQADHSKSVFLAQMSHEIRTPINAMLGMNEMIIRESKEESTLNYASNAYNSGNALLSIINDILDISKIEAGRLEIVEAEYDLYSLVSDCYNMISNRAEKKQLEFKVSCDEKLPSRLNGDMFHIRQIVVNLLTNAVKYTDKGTVELDISGESSDDGVILKFTVKDTGIGIKQENLDKLFTSFQRFDIQRNQSIEGTGLGLSICKQLTELMNGSVSAESVYGKGSTFVCTLPQKIISSEPIGSIRLEHSAEKKLLEEKNKFTAPEARILVVDDVEMNLFVFTSFLKCRKMRIDTALSGKSCIELVSKNDYDIIFMDHMMPELDGIETFEILRKAKYISEDTPVVMLTANAISGEKEKYLSKGFAAYLAKPIQSAKLDSILLEFLPKDKIIFRSDEPVQEEIKADEVPQGDSELFDIGTGIMYNGDNREIYHTVLKMYVTGGAEKRERIRSLAENKSWKEYITEVHALKSTSLMIGSKKLSDAAKELELAGKEEKYEIILEKNDALLELYGEVLEIGRKFLISEGVISENPPEIAENTAESAEISAERLDELTDALKKACGDFDDDEAVKICDELSGYSFGGHELKPLFGEVRALMLEFEYDAALERTDEIRKKIGAEEG